MFNILESPTFSVLGIKLTKLRPHLGLKVNKTGLKHTFGNVIFGVRDFYFNFVFSETLSSGGLKTLIVCVVASPTTQGGTLSTPR